MKKIKSIKQLQAEKSRIEQQQHDLENKIGGNWKELKDALKPGNMAKDIFNSVLKSRTEDNLNSGNAFKNTFSYGLCLLTKKVADKLGRKFSNLSKK
jgi:hypothetical protein